MLDKQLQLFILPYAGGSEASFSRLAQLVDRRVEVVFVEYSGRGRRAKEPLSAGIWEMLADVANFCCTRRNAAIPFAVMGYSMGSILAYELLSRQAIAGELKHLFIAAEVSPKERAMELRQLTKPTDEQVLARAMQLGGLDRRMLQNQRFFDIFIRPMLSDYRNFFGYHFTDGCEKVNVDATFFYCEADTALSDVMQWGQLIQGELDFHELGENHFFINQHYARMAEIINQHLTGYL